jgi:TP901 family phage tail tape measure protein
MPRELPIKTVFKAVDQISRPLKQMQSRVGRFSDNSIRKLGMMNKRLKSINQSMTAFGKQAAVAGAAVGAASAVVVRAGMGFEQAITNVGAVGLKTRAEIKPLEDLALKLGKTTEFTATQAANAMEVLARAGFNATQIMQATPAVLSAASASGLEIAEVAGHVSDALKGMGLAMNQSGRVADVLALASARTNSTIGTLGESIANVASTARDFNIPFEEVVASVAGLQDIGLQASVAGSAFNTMLTKMSAPSESIKKQMRRLGISFKDAKGNMKPLGEVLNQLNIASKKVGGNFDKVAFLADLVGLRGQKAASNLARLFETGKLQELTKELNNARGSAEKMAKIRLDTTEGSFKLLGSAIDGVQQALFGLRSGQIKEAIDNITAFISDNQAEIVERINAGVGKLVDNINNLAIAITGLVALKALTMITSAAENAMRVFKTLSGVVVSVIGVIVTAIKYASMASPWRLLLVAIGAGFTFFTLIKENWNSIKNFISGVLDFITWGINKVIDALGNLGSYFDDMFGGIFSKFGRLIGLISEPRSINLLAPSPISQRPTAEGLGLIDSVTSNTQTTENFVTIRDETGRAEMQGSNTPFINLLPSGA